MEGCGMVRCQRLLTYGPSLGQRFSAQAQQPRDQLTMQIIQGLTESSITHAKS
jgi:hypothetical protein